MKEKIWLRSKTAFVLPCGKKVKAGKEFEVSLGQAKYLLNNGKAEHVSAISAAFKEIAKTGAKIVMVETAETGTETAEAIAETAETGVEAAEASAEIAETETVDKPKAGLKGVRK